MYSLGFRFTNWKAEGKSFLLLLPPQRCPGAQREEQMYGWCGREKHYVEIAGGSALFNLLRARHAGGERWEGLEQA